jgi:glycosyltransferase involved in cell wall biosynthesis
VAHATYSVNGRLTVSHLEKLLLLFDVFEAQNGARGLVHNEGWTGIMRALTPESIRRLHAAHRIEPASDTPWIKGFTGGSDDHAGLFVGRTYTRAHAVTPEDFLDAVRLKRTVAAGRNSTYRALAFAIYKIAYEFSKTKNHEAAGSFLRQVSGHLFERERLGRLGRMRLARSKRRTDSSLDRMLIELVETLQEPQKEGTAALIEVVYDRVARIADEIVRIVLSSVEVHAGDGNLEEVFKGLSLALPGLLLPVPFLSAFRHLHADKSLLLELRERLGLTTGRTGKKLLWFTDTLTDLNGVSTTLQQVGWQAHRDDRDLTLVTCLLEGESTADLSPNVLALPASYHTRLPYYSRLPVKVPSLLLSLKALFDHDPDEIVISSPGPVGLLGLLMGRLLGAKCTGIFHTDFSAEAQRITQNESLASLVEAYCRWFYSLCDVIRVPTHEYQGILERRGYDRGRMLPFPRGIDTRLFAPGSGGVKERLNLAEAPTLLYVGRISQDKNLGLLAEAYERLSARGVRANLLVVGDGPDLADLQRRLAPHAGVRFAGHVPHASLPSYYAAADLFVFPSTTDTFGMAVLEAQACGLPALVAKAGGPQEIVRDGETGWVLAGEAPSEWEVSILEILDRLRESPAEYAEIRRRARRHVETHYTWGGFMRALFDRPAPVDIPPRSASQRPAGRRVPRAPRGAVQLALC